MAVSTCRGLNESGTGMWLIGWDQRTPATSLPSRVKYGDRAEGFHEAIAAKPLTEGCYVARTDGSG